MLTAFEQDVGRSFDLSGDPDLAGQVAANEENSTACRFVAGFSYFEVSTGPGVNQRHTLSHSATRSKWPAGIGVPLTRCRLKLGMGATKPTPVFPFVRSAIA